MSKELVKIFEYGSNNVRTVVKDNEPWFVAKDVCKILEISNHNDAIKRLSDKMKGLSNTDTLGGNQVMSIVSEAGVYKLVFTSRKPEAEKFTDWLTTEVIPSIRKYGAYLTPEAMEKTISDPDYIIGLITKIKKDKNKINQLEVEIENDKPKITAYNTLLAQKNDVNMLTTAKLLKLCGRNDLMKLLRKENIFINGKTIPYQRFIKEGYFKVIVTHKLIECEIIGFPMTLVTPKGLIWLRNRLDKYYEVVGVKGER